MILVHDLISLYILVLFVTALLSWFPTTSEGGLATAKNVLARLTEPVLRPIRSILPRPAYGAGVDFSVFIAIIILYIINANI